MTTGGQLRAAGRQAGGNAKRLARQIRLLLAVTIDGLMNGPPAKLATSIGAWP